jgi:hypothetical protein
MFLTWLMCISYFIISYYITMVIFDRLREKDQEDLEILDSQLKELAINHIKPMKQAI